MNDTCTIQDQIKESLVPFLDVNTNISIVAGHYCIASDLSDLSNEGESEIFSFELGVSVYNELKEMNISCNLILWINDIGIDKIQRKHLKENYCIPDNYLAVLQNKNVSKSEVNVVFESTSRNQASVLFRKVYKRTPDKFKIYSSNDQSLIRCIDTDVCVIEENKKAYTIDDVDGSPIVMKEGSNPKCNLILGTLFRSIINKHKSDVILNIFNDIYIDRIRLGVYVGAQVYDLKAKFINFFCDEDSIFREEFS